MDKNTQLKVNTELLGLLYKSSAFSLLAILVIAFVVSFQFWHEKESIWSLIWLAGMLILILFRYLALKKFQKSRDQHSDKLWKNIFYAHIFLTGCFWGASGLFFELQSESLHWFFTLFVLGGITAGAMSSLSPFSNAYILLAVPTFTPIIINLLIHDSEHKFEMILLLILYIALTSMASRRSHNFYVDVTLMRINHEEMKEVAENNLDLVQQHQIELYEKEGYLQSILDTALEAILTMNMNGNIELVNPAVEHMFGYTKDELIGKNVSLLMPDSIGSIHQNMVDNYINTNKNKMTGRKIEVEAKRKDGSTFPVSISVSDNIINDKHIFTSVMSDITEQRHMTDALKQKNTELTYLSSHDELTGIYNRRSVNEYLLREWDRAHRQKTEISVLMIDVDNFKKYNDNYGHLAGDNCLQRIAKTMQRNLHRPADYLGRFGGEEFIVVLPETGIQGATEVAEHLRNTVEMLKIPHKESKFDYVTTSIGIASTMPKKTKNYEQLISCADNALYQAKEQGRNCVKHLNKEI